MTRTLLAFVLACLPLVGFSTGCASATPEDLEPAAPAEAAPKSVGTLAFTARSADAVSGSYAREGVAIRFALRRDGEARFLTLKTTAGKALIESEYRDGVDTMRVLDGRAVQRGDVREDGVVEGDARALEEVFAMPEAKLVVPLKDALVSAGVAPFLVGRDAKGPSSGTLSPSSWYDGAYWYLGYGEQASFATWSFWGWTTLSAQLLGSSAGIHCLKVQAGWASPESLCGSQSIQRQWGGARLYVTYDTALCLRWGSSCVSGTYRVRTY